MSLYSTILIPSLLLYMKCCYLHIRTSSIFSLFLFSQLFKCLSPHPTLSHANRQQRKHPPGCLHCLKWRTNEYFCCNLLFFRCSFSCNNKKRCEEISTMFSGSDICKCMSQKFQYEHTFFIKLS